MIPIILSVFTFFNKQKTKNKNKNKQKNQKKTTTTHNGNKQTAFKNTGRFSYNIYFVYGLL
jgi:hypothetical protein